MLLLKIFPSPVHRMCCIVYVSGFRLDGFNICDIGGIVALYLASAGYFMEIDLLLTQAGALGIRTRRILRRWREVVEPSGRVAAG